MQKYLLCNNELLVEFSKYGEQLPMAFAVLFGNTLPWLGVSETDFDILRLGPSHSLYRFTWQQVLQNASVTLDSKTFFLRLADNGDLRTCLKPP
ncbi:TPA: hypothetical protein OOF66_001760 [Morganella morganii]|nr:hypothetical protein [Morganella morganii]HCR4052746.1 hypothetical protein [Morganella morganii]